LRTRDILLALIAESLSIVFPCLSICDAGIFGSLSEIVVMVNVIDLEAHSQQLRNIYEARSTTLRPRLHTTINVVARLLRPSVEAHVNQRHDLARATWIRASYRPRCCPDVIAIWINLWITGCVLLDAPNHHTGCHGCKRGAGFSRGTTDQRSRGKILSRPSN
jgi:hypothetical protein